MFDHLIYHQGAWEVAGVRAEVVIIANGNAAQQFKETAWLPLKKVAGQMTLVKANQESLRLKIPLCGNSHFLPARQNIHAMGATFHLNINRFETSADDDALNLVHFHELPIDWDFKPEIVGSWGGVRAAVPDYLPLLGPVVIPESFFATYAGLAKDSRKYIPKFAEHYPGLYLCSGFGSRGLTTIPFCSEWLAALINQEATTMPKKIVQSFSPSRFLRQKIIRSQ